MNEQLTIAFFIDFESILYVVIEKFEKFERVDMIIDSKIVENRDIWFFDDIKKINDFCETNEQTFIDFSMILCVNFDAKIRKSKILTNFRTWCWRIYSWNLLLKLKFCSQRLQIVRTYVIDIFFIDFDAKLNTRDWKFEHFDETNCKNVFVFNVENVNEQSNATISIRFDVNFRVINMNIIFVCFDVMLNVAIEKCEHFDDINSNIDVNVVKKIDEINETNEQIIFNFFLILYVNFDIEIRKFKFLTSFRTRYSRICSWNLLLKLKFCLQRLQIRTQTICEIEIFFIDFDANSNVNI